MLTTVLALVIGWRLALTGLSYSADLIVPYQPSFPYARDLLSTLPAPKYLYSFANFDGVHYLTIVTKGYVGTGLIQAFFPLYPLAARAFTVFGLHPFWSLLTISHLSLLGAAVVLYKLSTLDSKKQNGITAMVALLLFPTSFFLASAYGESLFLFLTLASFWSARKRLWLIAGLCAALASATRVVGIGLVPALLIELYLAYRPPSRDAQTVDSRVKREISQMWQVFRSHSGAVLSICLGGLGLLGYMLYLAKTFSDPLYFLHVQAEFGANRSESLIWYPQVVWRSIKILLTARPFDLKYFAYVQEFVAGTFGLLAIIYAGLRTRWSYLAFALIAFFMPTATGTFSSLPRYLLACIPLFLCAGSLKLSQPRVLFFLVISALLLIMNTILFVQGYWVA